MYKKVIATLFTVLLLATSCGNSKQKRVTVGSKNFTEQFIISELAATLLEESGFSVNRKLDMSSMAVRNGLTTGQVDLYYDYTGTAWATYLQQQEVISDPKEIFERVKEIDAAENSVIWLPDVNVNNTYALAVTEDFAQENGLSSISDLAAYVRSDSSTRFAMQAEFAERDDGINAVAKAYNMPVDAKQRKVMEISLSYEAVSRGDAEVAEVFSTDGKLKKFNLKVLEDDKNVFPPYSLCPLIRAETLEKYPEIEEILNPLREVLNDEVMTELNYQADIGGVQPSVLAKKFLEESGLI